MHVHSFSPVSTPDSAVLVLGTAPSAISIALNEYYANSRNAFWSIIEDLIHVARSASYDSRVSALRGARIALWDVLKSCNRAGSLDSKIERSSVVVNDFTNFYQEHPAIARVYFNGAAAEDFYRRHVIPILGDSSRSHVRLISTSPAAAIPYAKKLKEWRALLDDA